LESVPPAIQRARVQLCLQATNLLDCPKRLEVFSDPSRGNVVGLLEIPQCGIVLLNKKRYKSVEKKVRPVASLLPEGALPTFGIASEEHIHKVRDQALELETNRLTSERINAIEFGELLSSEEKEYFVDQLKTVDKAFAFNDAEKGRLRPHVAKPFRIYTSEHVPWNDQPPRIPTRLEDEVIQMLKKKLDSYVIEPGNGSYGNRWFVLRKPNGGLRFIQDLQRLNAVTIRDSGRAPVSDEFSERFAGYSIYSMLDLFSGYDQLPLHPDDRDLTAIHTPLGQMRMTCMPQGFTNAVPVFQQVVAGVLRDFIPEVCYVLIDDIPCKGMKVPDSTFVMPGIRKFVYSHVQDVIGILTALKNAGLTISGTKCVFGTNTVKVAGYIVTSDGRRITPAKIKVIEDWPRPTSVSDVLSFTGLLKYYRMFIKDFSLICEPLNALTRKGAKFEWEKDQKAAFRHLKAIVMSDPLLVPADYTCTSSRPLVLTCDASKIGLGAELAQADLNGHLRPIRWLSKTWTSAERKYSPLKLECLALVYSVKKLSHYLYGESFRIRTDAKSLLFLINTLDCPDPVMNRWLAYLKLFSFEISHLPGKENIVADTLSRLPWAPSVPSSLGLSLDSASCLNVVPSNLTFRAEKYCDEDRLIGIFLSGTPKPTELTAEEWTNIIKKSRFYLLRDGYLWKKGKNLYDVPRKVIGEVGVQQQLINQVHSGFAGGHRGVNGTFTKLKNLYYWKNMFVDVKNTVKECQECQLFYPKLMREPTFSTFSYAFGQKVHVDLVEMPKTKSGFRYFLDVRDNFTGFVDGLALKSKETKPIIKFLLNYIARYGSVYEFVADRGELNAKEAFTTLEKKGVKIRLTTSYHPQGNSVVERGHQSLRKALTLWCHENPNQWPQMLPFAFLADNVTIKRSTGYTPFFLMYGREYSLPLESIEESWVDLELKLPMSTEELLKKRLCQLSYWDECIDNAVEKQYQTRTESAENKDEGIRLRTESLQIGDLVLIQDPIAWKNWKTTFNPRWYGPYRVKTIIGNGSYVVSELNDVAKADSIHGSRLRKFYPKKNDLKKFGPENCRVLPNVAEDVKH
jgi:hypothetical protein